MGIGVGFFLKIVFLHDFVIQPCDFAALMAMFALQHHHKSLQAFVICYGSIFSFLALLFPNFMSHNNLLYIKFFLIHFMLLLAAICLFKTKRVVHMKSFILATSLFLIYLLVASICARYTKQNIAFTLHKPKSVNALSILMTYPYYIFEVGLFVMLIAFTLFYAHRLVNYLSKNRMA